MQIAAGGTLQPPGFCHRLTNVITKERCYTVAYLVSTTGIYVLSGYVPISFTLGTITLSLIHVVWFNKAVRDWDSSKHSRVRNWMIVACLVGASVASVIILRSRILLPAFTKAFNERNAGGLLVITWFFAGLVGCTGAAAETLYHRGKELLQTATWSEMRSYMEKSTDTKKVVNNLRLKLEFIAMLCAPDKIGTDWNPSTKIMGAAVKFCSADQQLKLFNRYLQNMRSLPALPDYRKEQESQLALAIDVLKDLPEDKQATVLPQMLGVIDRDQLFDKLPVALQGIITAKEDEMRKTHSDSVKDFYKRYGLLYKVFESLKGAPNEEELLKRSQELSELRNDVNTHFDNLKIYYPDFPRKEIEEKVREEEGKPKVENSGLQRFKELLAKVSQEDRIHELSVEEFSLFRKELIDGQLLKDIQQALSKQNAELDKLDVDNTPANYFLDEQRLEGYELFRECFRANTPEALDDALKEHEIFTMKEFIDRVLDGDQTLLRNKDHVTRLNHRTELLKRLNAYLEGRQKNTRNRIYTFLAGRPEGGGSLLVALSGKIAYRATIVLATVAPLVTYPKLFAAGAIAAVVASIAIAVYQSFSIFPKVDDDFRTRVESRFRASSWWRLYQMVTRRPVLGLFVGPSSQEVRTYDGANIFGKMRIIAAESLNGLLVLTMVFDREGHTEGIGGAIQGFATALEVGSLTSRGFRRIFPRAA